MRMFITSAIAPNAIHDLLTYTLLCMSACSLGGLYSRYAAAVLYSGGDGGTFAGLEGDCFLTTATPHLGTRSYTYLPIPGPVRKLAVCVCLCLCEHSLAKVCSLYALVAMPNLLRI
jgi:hypothetical protein